MAQAAVRQVTSHACHSTLDSNLASSLCDSGWPVHRPKLQARPVCEGSTASMASHGIADIGSAQHCALTA